MWNLLSDAINLSVRRPHILVKVLQIVEREEANDRAAIVQSKKVWYRYCISSFLLTSDIDQVADSPQIPMRGYLGNAFEVLQNSIAERYLLARLVTVPFHLL